MFSMEHPLHVTVAEDMSMNQRRLHLLFYSPIAGYALLALF
jgi:hypothetical protein